MLGKTAGYSTHSEIVVNYLYLYKTQDFLENQKSIAEK